MHAIHEFSTHKYAIWNNHFQKKFLRHLYVLRRRYILFHISSTTKNDSCSIQSRFNWKIVPSTSNLPSRSISPPEPRLQQSGMHISFHAFWFHQLWSNANEAKRKWLKSINERKKASCVCMQSKPSIALCSSNCWSVSKSLNQDWQI